MIQLYQTLDLRPIGIPQTLRLSQYDSDFEIIFELTNFDGTWILDTNTTAEVQGTKTDGHGYSADAVFDDQLKTVTIAGDVQMTAAAGRNVFEVVLFHDGDRLGSKNFVLDVERAALDAETTASDSKIKNFTAMVEAAEAAAEAAEQAASEFSTDTTLSVSGKAADAKAVGDAIASADAELGNIRVGVDATVYTSAGEAVRGQIGELKNDLNLIDNNVTIGKITLSSANFVNGTYNGTSFTKNNAYRLRTNKGIFLPKGSKITITPNTQSVEYDLFNKVADTGDINVDFSRNSSSSWITSDQEINISSETYVFFILKNTDNTAINPSGLTAKIVIYNSYAYGIGTKLTNYSEKAIFRVKPNWIDGYKIGSTGYRNTSDGSSISPFYEVKKGDVIHYDLRYGNATSWFVAFYKDANFTATNFVSVNSVQSVYGIQKGTYITPEDGYVVFVNKSDYDGKIVFADYIPDYLFNEKTNIPAYWDSTLNEVVSDVRSKALTIGKNIVRFFFITDAHWSVNAKHSPCLINKLSSVLNIFDVIFGGDIITGTQSTRELALNEVYEFYGLFENHVNLFNTIGNHDLNNNSGTSAELTINEAYPLYIQRAETFAITDKATMGAVYDNESQKTRVIQFLHPTSSYSNADVTSWLQAKINEKNNWTIIFVSHAYWNSEPAGTDLTVSSASLTLGKMIADTLASTGNSGFWLCGHTHRDYNAVIESDSGNSLAIICTTTDAYMYGGSDGGAEMSIGTNTEQAFDVVQIDTESKKVYMTRVGAGSNREINY